MCETSGGSSSLEEKTKTVVPFKKDAFCRQFLPFIQINLMFVLLICMGLQSEAQVLLPCKIRNGFYVITVFSKEKWDGMNMYKSNAVEVTGADRNISSLPKSQFFDPLIDQIPQLGANQLDAVHNCCPMITVAQMPNVGGNPYTNLHIELNKTKFTSSNASIQSIFMKIRFLAVSRLDIYDSNRTFVPPKNRKTSTQNSKNEYIEEYETSMESFEKYLINNGNNLVNIRPDEVISYVKLESSIIVRPVPAITTIMHVYSKNDSKSLDFVVSTLYRLVKEQVKLPVQSLIINSCKRECSSKSSVSLYINLFAIPPENKYVQALELKPLDDWILEMNIISRALITCIQSAKLETLTLTKINHIIINQPLVFRSDLKTTLCKINRKISEATYKVSYSTPRQVKLCKSTINSIKDYPLQRPPQVYFVDSKGDQIDIGYYSEQAFWFIEAKLHSPPNNISTGSSNILLEGELSVPVVNGIATFTNLYINSIGKNFRLKFEAAILQEDGRKEKTGLSVLSDAFEVLPVQLKLDISNIPYKAKEGQRLSPSPKVQVVDVITNSPPAKKLFQKYSWMINVRLLNKDFYNGSQLMGKTTKMFEPGHNHTYFDDLLLTKFGYKYRLLVELRTTPPKYFLEAILGPFDVERDVDRPRQIEESWFIQIKFEASYQSVLPHKQSFFTYFLNDFGFRYDQVLWGNVSISPGSVLTNATISGTVDSLQNTIDALQKEVNQGSTANFNGTAMAIASLTTIKPNSNVDSKDYSNLDLTDSNKNEDRIPDAWIVAIVLNVILGIVFIIVIIYWYRKHRRSSQRVYDTDDKDAKIFEKTIKSNGNLENKAASQGGLKGQAPGVFSIEIDEDLNSDIKSQRSVKSVGSRRRSATTIDRYDDRLSYLQENSTDDENRKRSGGSSRASTDESNRNVSSPSDNGSARSRRSVISKSSSDPNLSSANDNREEYDEIRRNSIGEHSKTSSRSRRNASRNSDRSSSRHSSIDSSGEIGRYDDGERMNDFEGEKYLVYEVSAEDYRQRDYISYVMISTKSPPTLTKCRQVFEESRAGVAIQQIASSNYVFVRESGKQVPQGLESSALVSNMFPNREIYIQIQQYSSGLSKKNGLKNLSKNRNKGFLKKNFVTKKVKSIHSNAIGAQCNNETCSKEATLKCISCGRTPYCSKRCMNQDLRYHSIVCHKPPWKG